MRWASRLLHEMHKLSTVSTGHEMWANFMHDKLWVWWTSTGSQNLLPKQTRSLLFATTSWSPKVNSKHQPSCEFLYLIYCRHVQSGDIWGFSFFYILPPLEQRVHIPFSLQYTLAYCMCSKKFEGDFNNNHGKSLLFGYYKPGFRCLELNLFFASLLRFERL